MWHCSVINAMPFAFVQYEAFVICIVLLTLTYLDSPNDLTSKSGPLLQRPIDNVVHFLYLEQSFHRNWRPCCFWSMATYRRLLVFVQPTVRSVRAEFSWRPVNTETSRLSCRNTLQKVARQYGETQRNSGRRPPVHLVLTQYLPLLVCSLHLQLHFLYFYSFIV